ncbi:MAG TPA: D-glycero-beta-D-manno-heptose-7-phosphate kinase [Nitrospiria bacterium]
MNRPKTPGTKKASGSLTGIINNFGKCRVLVVGDLMLDHYIWGRVDRISPEAPVPVVSVSTESLHLGGAANVANNIISLGGKVDLVGVVGEDEFGRRILHEMKQQGIGTEGIVVDRNRPTTKKTRVIAHSQQVVRFDRETRDPVSDKSRATLLEKAASFLPRVNSVLISDYAKGVVTEELIDGIRKRSPKNPPPVIVDPKVPHIPFYHHVDVITPNAKEALGASGLNDSNPGNIEKSGSYLLERLKCRAVLVTRGEKGMTLFEREGRVSHIPTVAREVYDVTGAGDTVIGTMALGISAGASMEEAAMLANFAAGIVVGTVGTATVTQQSLLEFVREHEAS